jgi:hypothetical protein
MSGGSVPFAAAFDAAFARLQVRVEGAYLEHEDWPDQVGAAIRAGLEFATENPGTIKTLTSDALAQGPEGIVRHSRMLAAGAFLLVPGRERRPENARLPMLTERALVGGIATLVAERLDRGCADELARLAPEAIEFALSPYLGPARARQIAGGKR